MSEIAWAIKNRTKIQTAYKAALKLQKVSGASNHNVVSLCLHSGPAQSLKFAHCRHVWGPSSDHQYFWWHGVRKGAWVGTGDALFEDAGAWNDFSQHFTQGHNRLDEWITVLMPHHGSGSGKNFNPGLLKARPKIAVFSAGAFNKYQHPSRSILDAVADAGAMTMLVTEYTRPGIATG
ncbi:MAG: hypothetical protein WCH44_11910 [Betaproteobacteria bacterium]